MMYPKPQRKKKRKKHKASILHCKDGTCYLCMKLKGDYRRYPVVHEHHIYDGPNRQNSEAEGLKVICVWTIISWGRRQYITITRICGYCTETAREPTRERTAEQSS